MSRLPTAGDTVHVVVTGGTGLIGARLTQQLRDRGDEVTIVSRTPGGPDTLVWDPLTPGSLELPTDTDAVIHLAGAPIHGCRWTDEYKQQILESREEGTRTVVEAIRDHGDVDHLVSASAVGYYGDRGDAPITETTDPADDFLATVCRRWEDQARRLADDDALAHDPAIARTGVVLSSEDGALTEMLNPFGPIKPFHWGLGGRLGDGQQWFPWIHIDDEVAALIDLLDERRSGAYNLTAPEPVRNERLTDALGDELGRPTPFPIPRFAMQLLYGEAAQLLFASQRVLPRRLTDDGFGFEHRTVEEAIADLLPR